MSSDDPDVFLLEQLRSRQGAEEGAFERLFERYYGSVYRVVYRLMTDHEAAEDLVQETFLTLYKQPPRLKAEAPLSVWLYRVALNRGYNVLRGTQRERQRLKRLNFESSQPDLEAEILRAEANSNIREALGRLSERQYKLIMLRQAGLNHAEIAAILEIAVGSVGTLLNRAERAFLVVYDREKTVGMEKTALKARTAADHDTGKKNG